MRTLTAEAFYETVNYCFNRTLETMGTSVREAVRDHLHSKGISELEISARFDDVFQVLTDSFGAAARIIIFKTLTELYQQYGTRVDFNYQDPLKEQFQVLQNRVFSDHLLPKKIGGQEAGAFHAYSTIVQAPSVARNR